MLRKSGIILLGIIGIIIFLLHQNATESNAEPVSMDEKARIYGIQLLKQEVSSDYNEEMLKVQAVLVRTTLYKKVEEEGADFLNQVIWTDPRNENILWIKKLENAWDETEGQVVLYDGKLALVPFHQISNGKTRSGTEVLGEEDYSYLKSVECPLDVSAPDQVGNQFIPITNVLIESWDSAGYVTEVSVDEEIISGEAFRDTYKLSSSCFEVQAFEGQTRILTKGVGHGLGLSQHTANEMAKNGMEYEEILQYFFPGTVMEEVAEILWKIE